MAGISDAEWENVKMGLRIAAIDSAVLSAVTHSPCLLRPTAGPAILGIHHNATIVQRALKTHYCGFTFTFGVLSLEMKDIYITGRIVSTLYRHIEHNMVS